VDGAVDTSSPKQGGVRRVADGVDAETSNIALDDFDAIVPHMDLSW
jgi:hypothetical protein